MSAESSCDPVVTDGNVGLAFGLVTAAGFSTTIGAAMSFFMPYSTSAKNLFLAISLSIAAGVMLYVSFVEIFATKAVEEFAECVDDRFAYLYATLCFFGGVGLTYLFDVALHYIQGLAGKRRLEKNAKSSAHTSGASDRSSPSESTFMDAHQQHAERDDVEVAAAVVRNIAAEIEPMQHGKENPIEIDDDIGHDGHMVANIYQNHSHDAKALIRMGIFAGIALAFHNFPEGLATFIAVLEDPSVGASVAIAIGIHNIPEGICVAMPIYYATGSRWKAFLWATLSGMTELVGAFLGWIVLRKVFNHLVYGILFGIVGGMMVYISLKELLPTAHRYDPEDKVTTLGLVIGMGVMAISLVMFEF